MKVEGPGRTQGPSSTSKKGKTSKGDGTFGAILNEKLQGASGTSAPQTVAAVDALLAAQEAGTATDGPARRRMSARADDILQTLDKVRMALLTGNLTVGDVINIADVVASHREKIMDPKLTAVLDEIDLRAQIEIAKMRKAMDNLS